MPKIRAKNSILMSFRKILKKKPFYKITVKEVSVDAKVTRQIFYYHFKNMRDLFEYFCYNEVSEIFLKNKVYKNFESAYKLFFKMLEERKELVKNSNYPESTGIFRDVLEMVSKRIYEKLLLEKVKNRKISEVNFGYIVDFYKLSLASIMYKWVNDGMKKEEENLIIRNLSILVDKNIENVISSFEEE